MSRAVVLAYAACALIWGTTWFAIRVCIGPGGYPTYDALALRFGLAVLVLVPIALRLRPWPDRRQWSWLVLAGLLDAAGYLLVYTGEETISGGIAAVVYGTQPLVLALFLWISKMERITPAHLLGAGISLAGVIVLFLDRLDVSARQAIGVALVEGSVIVATIYSMIMKRHAAAVHGVVATTIFLGVTAVALAVVALVAGEPIPSPLPVLPTVALVYLALVGSVIAFLAFFWLLAKTTLIVTSTLVFLYPIVALVTDALFEREVALTWRSYVGAGIVFAGLAVSLGRRHP
ncbi:MAG: DMT family transporter [Proteobacteria bacterium]|nr:DMT family transporter [Pseudomonadota bacterium]